MNPAREGFVEVNGLRLRYLEWGATSHPAMLLLHGGSAHAHWWDFFATPLADRFHVIALDLRGHGDSAWASPPDYEITTHAADVAAVAARLQLSSFVLVGHSFGALVAIAATRRLTDQLSALVVVDSSARITERNARYLSALRLLPHPVYTTLDEAIRRFRLLPTANGARAEVLAHVARHAVRQLDDGTWTLKFDRRGMGRCQPCDLAPWLQTFPHPLLLVRGGQSEYLSARLLASMIAAVPRACTLEIPGAHHHVMLDAPAELAAAVRAFVSDPRP